MRETFFVGVELLDPQLFGSCNVPKFNGSIAHYLRDFLRNSRHLTLYVCHGGKRERLRAFDVTFQHFHILSSVFCHQNSQLSVDRLNTR